MFQIKIRTKFTLVKKLAVIIALFMFFKPVLPVVEYFAFYDYIKNERCENQDNQELECNGKCHLKKELAKAADATEKGNENRTFPVEIHLVFFNELQENLVPFAPIYSNDQKVKSAYNNLYTYQKSTTVFHPPVLI